MSSSQRYDLAVVGGGIAGLYFCLKAPPGLKIALFEATDRFGGKVETVSTGGFLAEYGSMRFDPTRQPVIRNLIAEMGLETHAFPRYSAPPPDEGTTTPALHGEERGLDSLELFTLGIARVLKLSVRELMETSDEDLERIRRSGQHRGKPLFQHSLWQAFTDVLSYEAVAYIMTHGSFFHGIHENPGVCGTMITWVKMLQMSEHLQGLKGGVQRLTDAMLQKVRERGVEVFSRRRLISLAPEGKRVRLGFGAGDVSAAQAVLSMPSMPLKQLAGIPADIRTLMDSVIEYPLLKCFFVVKDPWWQEDVPNAGVLTMPARELHYHREGDRGIVMIYADRPYRNFWEKYVAGREHTSAELNGSTDLPSVFADRMGIDPDSVVASGIRDWVRWPYGAGVHLWRGGPKPWEVSERLEAFSLDGSSDPNVHICGEAFSDYQGFMEGALRSARNVLAKIERKG